MIPLSIILIIAIVYALIRAKHDSFLSHGDGRWKTWAFVEGGFIAISETILLWRAFDLEWWLMPHLVLIFAFAFWLVFDCSQGWIRTGNIFHLGEKGFDATMRKVFLYDKPILWWRNPGATRLVFFKLFWLGILIPTYFSLYN
ncbi:MAG: hypothetical protein V2B15_06540 [Bacteroidota bacterium]